MEGYTTNHKSLRGTISAEINELNPYSLLLLLLLSIITCQFAGQC